VLVILVCCGKRSKKKSKWSWDDIYQSFSLFKKNKPIPKKHESRCRFIFETLFQAPFTSIRPDFLRYKTGKNLELDGYNDELKLAFEYQGVQHRKYTPMFHKSYRDFVKQQERDQFKKEKCHELGIRLIEIPDTILFDDLETYIRQQVKDL
jgi:hypothetical protein